MDKRRSSKHSEELSSFELAKQARAKKIAAVEEQLVAEKQWHLTGEVIAPKRPKDSLLEEITEFETATRMPPTITEETTTSIEELIKARVRENLFDSVVRKIIRRPSLRAMLPTVSAQKSTLGLGELYTQKYKEEVMGLKEVDPLAEEHTALIAMWTAISSKLDSLSSYSFTTHTVIPTTTTPTTTAPEASLKIDAEAVAVSTAARLAPEEIKDHMKTIEKTEKEKTSSERDRERGKEKKRQKMKSVERKGRMLEDLRREREDSIKRIALGGHSVDMAELDEDAKKKAEELTMRAAAGGAKAQTRREKEEAAKVGAFEQLKRMGAHNVVLTGDGMKGLRRTVGFMKGMEKTAQQAIMQADGSSSEGGKQGKKRKRSESEDNAFSTAGGWGTKKRKRDESSGGEMEITTTKAKKLKL
ncbi:putative U3 small nucleolar ribonucleoprotein MPP10 [Monocercomonoides exilis]|uniref:putative U3 small nucleolar ribonucleoprotein MPP10 n=1 Tax=Monocercomonoides exilis TaxID=2049356 RepID=UPI0035599A70|nr:putative U3 small nucleolar ribonucleoprotein MPP10 [Monocercomonoides exilis]|eukprot:MONOS_8339.1-p1 / transcript=MONOS_8339.1 / gene=MONOS_8339 / organism=Monocercomonoides_exilis_PA203 / gene_product=U3 small nucleolar ribonucleoprotein MPP10 / transcript_product=U3 small nucleolar ribonucleoprotein MPP10 / location=Mono_scaffold00313:943-2378(-) / protein_length=415 / sequence_SO=supercontig / SO=protein_coding / is_pseudo=false